MDTQYYDTNNNFIEIPMLAAHETLPQGAQSVNDALSTLKERYTSVLSSPSDQPGGNHLLLFPAVTERYYNLVFYQGTADYGTDGTVFSLVYDREEDRLVTQEEALALAGTTLDALYTQTEDFLTPNWPKLRNMQHSLPPRSPRWWGSAFRNMEV